MKIREHSKVNRVIYVFIFLFYILFTGAFLPAGEDAGNAGKYGEAIKAFEDFVTERMDFDRAVGLSVGFMKDDFTWAKGFGYADLENKTPARAESSYRMASITKTFTAIAVLQLVEKGKINLDAEVQEYVPYFPKKKWPVTVRLLLGHLGGISHYRDYDKEGHIKVHKNTREALAIFQDFDLVAEPGTRYRYSSYGFNLLGAVVEGASGQSFGDYIKENIFKPLAMENSRMDDPVDLIPFRVRGYRIIKNRVKNSEYVDMSSRFAGGGTRSTVKDMLKYAKGVISNKLLKDETGRMMFTSMATREGVLTHYGMGWTVVPWNGHFRVSHSGAQQETQTYLLIFPGVNFAVAIGANLEGLNLFPYIIRLAELLLEEDLDTSAYAPGKEMKDMLAAFYWTFSDGLAYYQWHNAPLTADEQELTDAFAYFNGCVDLRALEKNYKETKKKLDAGIHPVSKQVFTKIGSFMAAALKEVHGEDALKSYHKKGAFAFFSDFIKISRQWTGQKKALTFSGSFAKTLARWEKDWNNTYTGEARDLVIMPGMDFKKVVPHLKSIFSGGRIYPDYSGDMVSIGRGFLLKGEEDKAFEILSLCSDLYPDSPGVLAHLAYVNLWKDRVETARGLFKKAAMIDPGHYTLSPGWLNWFAEILEENKKTGPLFELASIALELHPSSARVHRSVGDLYLEAGQKEKAMKYYRKAVTLKLDLSEVKSILEKLEKSERKDKR